MIFLPRLIRHPAYRRGFIDMAALALGLAAWGLMTGVAMVQLGLGTGAALAMVLLVFAGSAQLAATPLMLSGAPLWVVLAAAFCVNLRFVVFSAHLRPYVMHLPRWQRLLTGYFTGDLSYVLFVQRYPQVGADAPARDAQMAYLAGNCGINWFAWTLSSVVGVLLASAIPNRWGLGFAGVLALLGMVCALVNSRLRLLAALVAACAAVLCYALPLKLNILAAIASAVALCLLAEQTPGLREPRA